jgi:hypothetical protein
MYRSISWKKAGVIVVLLHVAGIGALIGFNNITSHLRRVEREKAKTQQLAKLSEPEQQQASWPEPEGKKILVYPKQIAKKVTDTVESKSLQDSTAEKITSILETAVGVKDNITNTYQEAKDLYTSTTEKLTQAREQTVAKAKEKIATKPVLANKTSPTPKPTPRKIKTNKPSSSQTVYREVKEYNSENNQRMREEFITTRRVVPAEEIPTIEQMVEKSYDVYVKNSGYVTSRPGQEPNYKTLRYVHEQVVRDPYTGAQRVVRIVGPPPLPY